MSKNPAKKAENFSGQCQTKFIVRLNEQNNKDVTPSLTNHSTNNSCLNVVKKNQLSRFFGRLDEAKNGDKAEKEANSMTRNLFGSCLENVSTAATSGSAASATDNSAEFKKDPAFANIKKVVDSLKSKGVLDSNGELTSSAFVDDNCARDDPVLHALIETANCVNKNWLSSNRVFFSGLANRCKLVSMLYETLMQQHTISDTLALSDIMNSKIAYNIWRGSNDYPPPPSLSSETCSNNGEFNVKLKQTPIITKQPQQFSLLSTPKNDQEKQQPATNTQANKQPDTSKTPNMNNSFKQQSQKQHEQQQQVLDTSMSSNFSVFDVSLESVMDKQVLDMIIREPTPTRVVAADQDQANTSRMRLTQEEIPTIPSDMQQLNSSSPCLPPVRTPQNNTSFLDESSLSLMSLNFFNCPLNDSSADFRTRVDSLGRIFPLTPQLNTDSEIDFDYQRIENKKRKLLVSEEEQKRRRKLDETVCGNGQDNDNNENDKDSSDEKIKIVMNSIINKIESNEIENGELEEGECL